VIPPGSSVPSRAFSIATRSRPSMHPSACATATSTLIPENVSWFMTTPDCKANASRQDAYLSTLGNEQAPTTPVPARSSPCARTLRGPKRRRRARGPAPGRMSARPSSRRGPRADRARRGCYSRRHVVEPDSGSTTLIETNAPTMGRSRFSRLFALCFATSRRDYPRSGRRGDEAKRGVRAVGRCESAPASVSTRSDAVSLE